jgi:hypothetical protein
MEKAQTRTGGRVYRGYWWEGQKENRLLTRIILEIVGVVWTALSGSGQVLVEST